MTTIVFCGPTLPVADVQAVLPSEVRPPAARGDILSAALESPRAIGLIDGRFDGVPSVWHKEILWAMARGIHVWGGASMGALRAAELDAFGMIGRGSIYEGYRSGDLEDDDEVVVAHAGPEYGYRALSDALVNLRCSFEAAASAGAISVEMAPHLVQVARSLPYPERTMVTVVRAAESQYGWELGSLRSWLTKHRVDQKREDALLMLREMRERELAGWGELKVTYEFAHTDAWQALERQVRQQRRAGSMDIQQKQLRHELLLSNRHAAAHYASLARALAEAVAPEASETNERAMNAFVDAFRRERGLESGLDFERWISEQEVSEDQLTDFFRREVTFRRSTGPTFALLGHLTDQLRADGQYSRLAERAKAKQAALSARGLASAGLAETGLTRAELWRWCVSERLRTGAQATLEAHAQSECVDPAELQDAIAREYLYAKVMST